MHAFITDIDYIHWQSCGENFLLRLRNNNVNKQLENSMMILVAEKINLKTYPVFFFNFFFFTRIMD